MVDFVKINLSLIDSEIVLFLFMVNSWNSTDQFVRQYQRHISKQQVKISWNSKKTKNVFETVEMD